jgi:hypothetical protein
MNARRQADLIWHASDQLRWPNTVTAKARGKTGKLSADQSLRGGMGSVR